MNRKFLPLVLMLVAGAVTCFITYLKGCSIITKVGSMLVVLLIFYVLGSVLKYTLDTFEKANEKKAAEAEKARLEQEAAEAAEKTETVAKQKA